MTQATTRLTFEEYANLNAEDWVRLGLPEGRCEYVDEWELNELPTESEPNDWIAQELFWLLAIAQIVPRRLIRPHSCEIEVPGKPKTRFPDLVVLQEEHIALTQRRLLIRLNMPVPQMVVEVVSSGNTNHKRDYEAKRKQYEQRGIPEYWLIMPETKTIEVLELNDRQYVQIGTFAGVEPIQSKTFKGLNLTVNQVFAVGQ